MAGDRKRGCEAINEASATHASGLVKAAHTTTRRRWRRSLRLTHASGLAHPYVQPSRSGAGPRLPCSRLRNAPHAYDDPVNRTDPSGLCPDLDEDGKCDPGWQCFNIENLRARNECLKNTCWAPDCPARWPIGTPRTATGYGKVFTDILRWCPGPWKANYDTMRPRVVEKLSMTLALTWEANGQETYTHFDHLGEAMAHKYWDGVTLWGPAQGLHWWLGGRQSLKERIRAYLSSPHPVSLWEGFENLSAFNRAWDAAGFVFTKYDNQPGSLHPYWDRPYDWANPLSPDHEYGPYRTWLVGRKVGSCGDQVFSISYDRTRVTWGDQCVLTWYQLNRCGDEGAADREECQCSH